MWSYTIIFMAAFLEAALLPIPVEIFFLPYALWKPKKAYVFFVFATLGTLVGGLAGYYLGDFLFENYGYYLSKIVSQEQIQQAQQEIQSNGFQYLVLAGLSPIPFTAVAFAAGAASYNIYLYALATLLTRAPRYLLMAWLVSIYGKKAKKKVEKYERYVWFLGVALVVAFVIYKVL